MALFEPHRDRSACGNGILPERDGVLLPSALTSALVGLALLPTFVDASGTRSNLAVLALRKPPSLDQPVHLAALAPILVAVYLLVRDPSRLPWSTKHLPPAVAGLFTVGAVFTTASLAVVAAAGAIGTGGQRYLQTVLVISPLFIAGRTRLDSRAFGRAVLTFSSISIILVQAYTSLRLPSGTLTLEDRFELADAFPQYLVTLPFLGLIAIIAAIVLREQSTRLRVASGVLGVSFFAVNWSRSAVLLAVIGVVVAVMIAPSHQNVRQGSSRTLRFMAAAVVASAVVAISASSVAATRAAEAGLRSGRAEIALEAVSRIARSPLTGEGFISRDPDGGKPFDTHNLFLELLMRGGLLGGCAMILSILLVWRSLSRNRIQRDSNWALGFSLLSVALLGGLSNPYLLQPFPGIFIWLTVGAALTAERQAMRNAAASALPAPGHQAGRHG